jgi:hypothetical protein
MTVAFILAQKIGSPRIPVDGPQFQIQIASLLAHPELEVPG